MLKHTFLMMGFTLSISLPAMAQDPIQVTASEDLSVRRGDGEGGPVKERGLHPKTVSEKEKNPLDRFVMIRFDSADFGKDVRAVEFSIQARSDDTYDGRFRFRVYGVIDGDKEDEVITEKDYDPGAEGSLFDGSRNMLDRKQVAVLGSFSTKRGETVRFSSNLLTSFVRSDTNGTVTLVIIRESESPDNSVFEDRKTEHPPTLKMIKKSS